MSAAGALAMTGSVFLFAALMVAFVSVEAPRGRARVMALIAWPLFAAACAFFIAAPWTAYLT